ncbi:MAG: energy transducer TonB [Spirosoma sp.]|nr:energy transducer TonB [Spirosoma sp.]
MNALAYFLNASLYLILFYSCYWLMLRRNTFFGLNRAYLLASVGLSFVMPLIELPGKATNVLPGGTLTLPTFVISENATAQTNDLTAYEWIWVIYGLGVAAMLIRLVLNAWTVRRLIMTGTVRQRQVQQGLNYRLVYLPNDSITSFSFGRYLVLNQTDALTKPDALIRHEEAHICQHHTIDILFIEIARAAFWFNPVLWLYKRSLQEVHEFLADEAVTRMASHPDYARQLVAYALNVPATMLTTPFVSVSTLKQRIVMLQKPASNRRALLGYALVMPLAGLLTLCTQPDRDVTQTERPAVLNQSARVAGVDGNVFTVVEEQPEFQGGLKNLGPYLSQHLKYPEAARKASVQGKVFVNFVVTKSGEIADVKILKGIGFGADEEAVRVVSGMPRWVPGKQSGKAVNVQYNLPINFQLSEGKATANGKLSAFFSFPTNNADLQKRFKHFVVDGNEVSFNEFSKYPKDAIVEASSSQQTIRIQTLPPPPPPPPVPASEHAALRN